jgi:hypothetical protein
MGMDLEETSTLYHAGKIDQQLLLISQTWHDSSKFTIERIWVITLNKPRIQSAKDLNTLLKNGNTTTCWNHQKFQMGTISTGNKNPSASLRRHFFLKIHQTWLHHWLES